MRVLLFKTSSMGDLIHTFPALSDAARAISGITFDWVVEEAYAQIPAWHASVKNIIPIAFRKWRKNIFARETIKSYQDFYRRVHKEKYDLILDAQGLLKSAILTLSAHGVRGGLDAQSARERFAALFYTRKAHVNFKQHAVVRMRSLFSQLLHYPLPETAPEFGIARAQFQEKTAEKYIVFLHGTTWATKTWPEEYWRTLAQLLAAQGYSIKIAGGNAEEIRKAHAIAAGCPQATVLPGLDIVAMAKLIAGAQAVVAVDTGFGHLAAALGLPTVSLYGPTDPAYTGALGEASMHLAADFACAPCLRRKCSYREAASLHPPCFSELTPELVASLLQSTTTLALITRL